MLKWDVPKSLSVPLLGVVGALFLAIASISPVLAADPYERILAPIDGQVLAIQSQRQILRDDLTVEQGQTIDDDVFIYSGNVDVQSGGRITGDLIVFSGNVEIAEDSSVDGDVTNYSGNITVAGHVGGDLAAMSGNVELDSTASVDGDISVVSGSIDRDDDATVSGDVVQGPSFRFPGSAPRAPKAPGMAGVSFSPAGPGFFEQFFAFIARLIGAALMTAFVMLLVGGLFYLRPQWVADTRKRLHEQLALSVTLGAVANLTVLFLAGLLAMTLCLIPIALIPLLALVAVNILGWAVVSQIVGERIVLVAKQTVQPALTILVGAFFLTGICALLWAFGGCFRFVAYLTIFAVSSFGAGAVLIPWINRRKGNDGMSNGGSGGVPPSGPQAPKPAPGDDSPVEKDIAEPIDYVTAEEVVASQEQDASSTKASSPRSKKVAEGSTPASRKSAEPIEQDLAAPIDYVTAQEVVTAETLEQGDDFLQIKGIGPSYARRLKDAGYQTYAQIAAASAEQIATAIGWPVDRVRRSELIDQAKVLAK